MAGLAVKSAAPPGAAALVQLDAAFHLLRRRAWLLFYSLAGTMPFGLGLLYFWSDMSRSAYAAERCSGEALLLALLYVWMKVGQSRYMTALQAELAGTVDASWSPRRWLRAAAQQAAIQSPAPVVLLLASLPMLPSAWCFAFYQNAGLYGNGEPRPLREICRRSWQQARYQPLQNHILLAVLTLFALFVFLELLLAMLFLPGVVHALSGAETVFTRSGASVVNSTLFAVAGVLCHIVLDPLVKAAYVLRCFHSEATHTGADLLCGLRQARDLRRPSGPWTTLMAVVVLVGALPLSGAAAPPSAATAASQPVAPPALEQAVRQTLQEARYSWRLPRTHPPDQAPPRERGVLGRFLEQIRAALRRALLACRDLAQDALRWLRRVLRSRDPGRDPDRAPLAGWQDAVPYLVVALTALVVSGLALQAWRSYRRRRPAAVATAVPTPALPDLADDAVSADQRPHHDWLDAARQLSARGELRLGLRAAYLASLALLGERRLLTIARHKSNLDYRRELARRASRHADLVRCFAANVSLFDRVWYGAHPAEREQVDAVLADLERMRAALEP